MSSDQLEALLLESFADGVYVSAKPLACESLAVNGTLKTVKDARTVNLGLRSVVRKRVTQVSKEAVSVFVEALNRDTHPMSPYQVFSGSGGNTVLRVSGTCLMSTLLIAQDNIPLLSNKRLTKAQCGVVTKTTDIVKKFLNARIAIEFHLGRNMSNAELAALVNFMGIQENISYVLRQSKEFKRLMVHCRKLQTSTYPKNPEETEFPPIVIEGPLMSVATAKFESSGSPIKTLSAVVTPRLPAMSFTTTRAPKDTEVINIAHYLNPTASRVYAAIFGIM